MWAVAKTQDRQGTREASYPNRATKSQEKITLKQMWFDLTAARTAPRKIDQQLSAVLVGLWKALKMEHFRPAPTTASAPPTPAEASWIQFYFGWVPPMSTHRMQDKTASR